MRFSQNFEQSNWACCVHADEVSSSDYKRLFSLLEAIYAEAVAYEVGKLTKGIIGIPMKILLLPELRIYK